ncbi:hypothetical protein NCC78_07330 [Micromonospora phytophila]|uniref:hypothetical protein n=1 Tax=Micromonospora phytophila TaxID=709888 RepID=UPI00202E79DC|nr:hypothetical protein [Micromonospora phytophila]MCM0674498.1 hypothetical protein [Micromonospora phytophila]
MATGDIPDPPARTGWRRILLGAHDGGVDVVMTALAALIVLDRLADPGDVRLGQLVALTAAGSYLLPNPVGGLLWLLRRGRRGSPDRRGSASPKETDPDRNDQPDQVGVSPEPDRGGIKPDRPERAGSGETPDSD